MCGSIYKLINKGVIIALLNNYSSAYARTILHSVAYVDVFDILKLVNHSNNTIMKYESEERRSSSRFPGGVLGSIVKDVLLGAATEYIDSVQRRIRAQVDATVSAILTGVVALVVTLLGVIFLLVGIVQLLALTVGLPYAYLLVGGGVMIIGLLLAIKMNASKNSVRNK
jgi:hypothetical protein